MMRRDLCLFFLLVLLSTITVGCASRKAYVLAHRDPQFSPNPTNGIALIGHIKPRPEEQGLYETLTAELKQQGFRLVPEKDADYTLTYWIEENWRLREFPVQTYDPVLRPAPLIITPSHAGMVGVYAEPFQVPPRATATLVEDSIAVQGIRLQLFSRSTARTRPQRAWEGYIGAGFKVSPGREPLLVRTLLRYFGKDFTGHARLVE